MKSFGNSVDDDLELFKRYVYSVSSLGSHSNFVCRPN